MWFPLIWSTAEMALEAGASGGLPSEPGEGEGDVHVHVLAHRSTDTVRKDLTLLLV